MSAATTGGTERPRGLRPGSTPDVVNAVLELLETLPDRPDRLRVRAGDVVVDLDWRKPATPLTTYPSADNGQALTTVVGGASGTTDDAPAEEPPPDVHYICSPSVGTYYRSPEPGAAPFVDVGAVVNRGQQIAIVEAMKLMLPIEADRSGRVVELLVDDGQSVEFGQQLMTIAPVDAA